MAADSNGGGAKGKQEALPTAPATSAGSGGTLFLPRRYGRKRRSTQEIFEMVSDRAATLYRMVLPEHTCPFGVRAKELLEANGYEVEDHILRSREAVDAFEAEHGVETTPQIFIGGVRIGGSDDLEEYLSAR